MASGWTLLSSIFRALSVLLAAEYPAEEANTLFFGFLLRGFSFLVAEVGSMLTLRLGSPLALGSQLVFLFLWRWDYLFWSVV